MDKNIPSKQIRSNNKLPWFNKKIKRMLKKKQSLYNQAKITKKVVKLQILPKRMQTTNTERRMELIEVKSLIWAQKGKLYIIYEKVM